MRDFINKILSVAVGGNPLPLGGGWKVFIELRTSKGKESFYHSLGFQTMSESGTGSGMEKMIEG